MTKSKRTPASDLDREAALVLGLSSAAFWFVLGVIEMVHAASSGGPMLVRSLLLGALLLLSCSIAWRWEVIGGFLVLYEGIFFVFVTLSAGLPPLFSILLLLTLDLPSLIAGGLFLFSWLEEKTLRSV